MDKDKLVERWKRLSTKSDVWLAFAVMFLAIFVVVAATNAMSAAALRSHAQPK